MTDEGLVRDLDGPIVDDDEAGICESLQNLGDVLRLLGARAQLVERHATTCLLRPVANLRQPQEDAPGKRLLLWRERVAVDGLGRLRDGSFDTAGLQVAEQRQQPSAATLPGLEQSVREQGKSPRLPDDVANDPLHDARLQEKAGMLGRPLDRTPKLFLSHRTHEHLVVAKSRGEARVRSAVAVEICA
jgi:hypothetical protein